MQQISVKISVKNVKFLLKNIKSRLFLAKAELCGTSNMVIPSRQICEISNRGWGCALALQAR